jgi:hypothetical protein
LYEANLCFLLSLFGRNHGDEAAVLTAFVEFHHAVDEGIERVVTTHANILAGVVGGAALTDNDVAGDALLTTKNLNA